MSTGLGWPAMADSSPAALGWPLQPAPTVPGTGPVAAPVTAAMADELEDLPMAVALRDELAAVVSRETDRSPSPVALQVSRETDAESLLAATDEEPPLADVTNHAPTTPLLRGSRFEVWPRPTRQRVLGVANQKGGVGKTTSTVNLAAALALHGARVLVIDLDPQGNASTAFGVDHRGGTPSVYDVLVDGKPLADVAVPVADLPGLFCVPATIDLAGAEIELVSMVARESRLGRALNALPEQFDFVFVDCPPSLGLLTVNALVAAQEVLIPIQCEFYALEGLSQLLRNIDLVRAHLNPDLHVSTILLTMYDGRTRLAEQVAQEVRTHFGDLVLGATIPRSVRISEAPGYGQSVMTYDPASRGAVAYVDAAREIAERSVAEIDGASGPPVGADTPVEDLPSKERSAE